MEINKKIKFFLTVCSFMMALCISLGAFGAHALKDILSETYLEIYNTAVSYHFYNTLGLFAASFIMYLKPNSKGVIIASWLILVGMILFSFSLYFLVLFENAIFGPITPIGGSLLIIAWLLLAISIYKD
ncbi:MAG: DUF423 domain-containing protein [Arcobacter sp.]|nr:DUF423 domain-containing protein [Arcobacter sp.]